MPAASLHKRGRTRPRAHHSSVSSCSWPGSSSSTSSAADWRREKPPRRSATPTTCGTGSGCSGCPTRARSQSLLLHGDTLIHVANTYYAAVHFPATVAFLVWLYLRRPAHYLWARRVLAAVTGAALVLHLLFPLAPPRMLAATGLIDTARLFGPSVYGPPRTDTLSNQFAAMPSLHFGWALMLAIGLIVATRTRWRWLWLLHPLVTLLVIVGTANHYWLDVIVATALLGLALAVLRLPERPGRPRCALPHRRTEVRRRSSAERPELVGAGR